MIANAMTAPTMAHTQELGPCVLASLVLDSSGAKLVVVEG